MFFSLLPLAPSPTSRLINLDDPPRECVLPALLGPAKQSACFSVCNKDLKVDSTAALRYFVQPPLNADLSDGLPQFLERPFLNRAFQRARRLDNVFRTCLESQNSAELLKAEAVTRRGDEEVCINLPTWIKILNTTHRIMARQKIDLIVSYHYEVLHIEEDSTRLRFE
ncbi:hypothetical protein B0H17DRAFT_1147984 [Mycena rosella]|uniref:RAI1-like domain-containing protein n=1 Tax=Mycena rosella TaxID=1033263 RepID=A0AAD7CH40_MYCRO|nr:hypothetical protein B0H17DRAFT_1147984 [Mycena rosella]